jgi:hypothetical protein
MAAASGAGPGAVGGGWSVAWAWRLGFAEGGSRCGGVGGGFGGGGKSQSWIIRLAEFRFYGSERLTAGLVLPWLVVASFVGYGISTCTFPTTESRVLGFFAILPIFGTAW